MNKNLSYIGIFKNEANKVRYILDMVKFLCPTLYLGVQPSEDDTLKICSEYTTNIFERPNEAPFYSKDFLASQVKTDWFCWFDADEIPSIPLFNYLNSLDFNKISEFEGIQIPRTNYINGVECSGGQINDYQFMVLRKEIRWNPTPERAIHIWPKLTKHFRINYPVYHIRTLDKIERRTQDWNRIQPNLKEVCESYVTNIKSELKNYRT